MMKTFGFYFLVICVLLRDCSGYGVGFSVSTGSYLEMLYKGATVPFKSEYFNEGEGFNTTTGKFTCDMDGVYQFSSTIITKTKGVHLSFMKNDKVIGRFYRDNTSVWGSGAGVAIIRLVQGDQVWVVVNSKNTDIHQYSSFHGVWVYF